MHAHVSVSDCTMQYIMEDKKIAWVLGAWSLLGTTSKRSSVLAPTLRRHLPAAMTHSFGGNALPVEQLCRPNHSEGERSPPVNTRTAGIALHIKLKESNASITAFRNCKAKANLHTSIRNKPTKRKRICNFDISISRRSGRYARVLPLVEFVLDALLRDGVDGLRFRQDRGIHNFHYAVFTSPLFQTKSVDENDTVKNSVTSQA
jgi:hypothetical protein